MKRVIGLIIFVMLSVITTAQVESDTTQGIIFQPHVESVICFPGVVITDSIVTIRCNEMIVQMPTERFYGGIHIKIIPSEKDKKVLTKYLWGLLPENTWEYK